jgi:hypothetical protein
VASRQEVSAGQPAVEVQKARHLEVHFKELEKVKAEIDRVYHLYQDSKLTPASFAGFFRPRERERQLEADAVADRQKPAGDTTAPVTMSSATAPPRPPLSPGIVTADGFWGCRGPLGLEASRARLAVAPVGPMRPRWPTE